MFLLRLHSRKQQEKETIELRRGTGTVWERYRKVHSRSDITQQLRELNDLKVMGVLSEDEFADKKEFLLNDPILDVLSANDDPIKCC